MRLFSLPFDKMLKLSRHTFLEYWESVQHCQYCLSVVWGLSNDLFRDQQGFLTNRKNAQLQVKGIGISHTQYIINFTFSHDVSANPRFISTISSSFPKKINVNIVFARSINSSKKKPYPRKRFLCILIVFVCTFSYFGKGI